MADKDVAQLDKQEDAAERGEGGGSNMLIIVGVVVAIIVVVVVGVVVGTANNDENNEPTESPTRNPLALDFTVGEFFGACAVAEKSILAGGDVTVLNVDLGEEEEFFGFFTCAGNTLVTCDTDAEDFQFEGIFCEVVDPTYDCQCGQGILNILTAPFAARDEIACAAAVAGAQCNPAGDDVEGELLDLLHQQFFPEYEDLTDAPTANPTVSPTLNPTLSPTLNPTLNPTDETDAPTENPTGNPTGSPTVSPTANPTLDDGNLEAVVEFNAIDEDLFFDFAFLCESTDFSVCLDETTVFRCAGQVFTIESCEADDVNIVCNRAVNEVFLGVDDAACAEALETDAPTENPTVSPTDAPTVSPTANPTTATDAPTESPTVSPTLNPTDETDAPTENPTLNPTESLDLPDGPLYAEVENELQEFGAVYTDFEEDVFFDLAFDCENGAEFTTCLDTVTVFTCQNQTFTAQVCNLLDENVACDGEVGVIVPLEEGDEGIECVLTEAPTVSPTVSPTRNPIELDFRATEFIDLCFLMQLAAEDDQADNALLVARDVIFGVFTCVGNTVLVCDFVEDAFVVQGTPCQTIEADLVCACEQGVLHVNEDGPVADNLDQACRPADDAAFVCNEAGAPVEREIVEILLGTATAAPTGSPTTSPTGSPTTSPTGSPTTSPTANPTETVVPAL